MKSKQNGKYIRDKERWIQHQCPGSQAGAGQEAPRTPGARAGMRSGRQRATLSNVKVNPQSFKECQCLDST